MCWLLMPQSYSTRTKQHSLQKRKSSVQGIQEASIQALILSHVLIIALIVPLPISQESTLNVGHDGLIISQVICNNARQMKWNVSSPLGSYLIYQYLLYMLMKYTILSSMSSILSKNIYTLFIAHHISKFSDKPEYTDFKGH